MTTAYTDVVVADDVDYLFICDDYVGPTGNETATNVSLGNFSSGYVIYTNDTSSGAGSETEVLVDADSCYRLASQSGGTANSNMNFVMSSASYTLNDRAISFWFRVNSISYGGYGPDLFYLYESGYESTVKWIHIEIDDNGTGNAPRIRGKFKHSTGTLTTPWIELTTGDTYFVYADLIDSGDLVGRLRVNDDDALEETVTQTAGAHYRVHDSNFRMRAITSVESGDTCDIDMGMVGFWLGATPTDAQITDHFAAGLAPRVNMFGSGTLGLNQWFMAEITDGSPPKSLQVEADLSKLLSYGSTNAGVFARYQSSDTFYAAIYEQTAGGVDQWVLVKMDGGTRTDLDTATITGLTDGEYHISLTIVDNNLEVVVNNTSVCTATDSGITAAGKYGILYRA